MLLYSKDSLPNNAQPHSCNVSAFELQKCLMYRTVLNLSSSMILKYFFTKRFSNRRLGANYHQLIHFYAWIFMIYVFYKRVLTVLAIVIPLYM